MNLVDLPEDLFLSLIFPQINIKQLMQLKYLSKQFSYLVDRYQKVCSTTNQIKPFYIYAVSALFPKLHAEVIIKRRTKFASNDFSRLKSLTFHRSEVSLNLAEFTSLERLTLFRVRCKEYRGEFANISSLTNLQYLNIENRIRSSEDIHFYAIRGLEIAIPYFTELQHLVLRNVTIEFNIALLTKLTRLELQYCYSDKFNISKLSNLTYLSIISRTPHIGIDATNLSKLTHLYISNSTGQYTIPIDLSKLPNLVELYISNYSITYLPASLVKFTYINTYGKNTLPIGCLSPLVNLTELNLSSISNTISIEHLVNLKGLILSYTSIEGSLPIGIERLYILNLYGDIRYLDLTKLTKLKHITLYEYLTTVVLPEHYIKKRIIKNCSNIVHTYKK